MYNALFAYLGEKDVKYIGHLKLSTRSSIKIGGTVEVGIFPYTIEQLIFTPV